MSARVKIIFFTIAGILLSILIIQCKSPVPAPEAQTVIQADTIKVDTAKTIVAAIPPHVAVHTPLTMVIKNLASTTAPVIVGLYEEGRFVSRQGERPDFTRVRLYGPNAICERAG